MAPNVIQFMMTVPVASMLLGIGVLTAQAPMPPDPISGGAGWIGAGLLGLVLSWLLLKHLPDKDKQIRDLMKDHLEAEKAQRAIYAEAEKDQRTVHASLEREQRAEYRQTFDVLLDHFRRRDEGLAGALKTDMQVMQEMLESVRDTLRDKP